MSNYVKIFGKWQEVESTGPAGHVLKSTGVTVSGDAKLHPVPCDACPVVSTELSAAKKAIIKKAQQT